MRTTRLLTLWLCGRCHVWGGWVGTHPRVPTPTPYPRGENDWQTPLKILHSVTSVAGGKYEIFSILYSVESLGLIEDSWNHSCEKLIQMNKIVRECTRWMESFTDIFCWKHLTFKSMQESKKDQPGWPSTPTCAPAVKTNANTQEILILKIASCSFSEWKHGKKTSPSENIRIECNASGILVTKTFMALDL